MKFKGTATFEIEAVNAEQAANIIDAVVAKGMREQWLDNITAPTHTGTSVAPLPEYKR